ncbi:MAG: hypothetical protein ACLPVF_04345 [Acidimicrobiales bacterium]
MEVDREEGWYTDPFGRHEARWLSNGAPTKLVRDAGQESYDDPPDEAPSLVPEVIESAPASGDNYYRPDDQNPEGLSLDQRIAEAAEYGATWGSHMPMPGDRDR